MRSNMISGNPGFNLRITCVPLSEENFKKLNI